MVERNEVESSEANVQTLPCVDATTTAAPTTFTTTNPNDQTSHSLVNEPLDQQQQEENEAYRSTTAIAPFNPSLQGSPSTSHSTPLDMNLDPSPSTLQGVTQGKFKDSFTKFSCSCIYLVVVGFRALLGPFNDNGKC